MMRTLEMYEIGPDDISEDHITLQWESKPADKPPLCPRDGHAMSKQKQTYTLVEKDADTGLYVGYVPGFAGAHSQGETLDELQQNLLEVIEMLLEEGKPTFSTQFRNGDKITYPFPPWATAPRVPLGESPRLKVLVKI